MRPAPRLALASVVVAAIYVVLSALVTLAFAPWASRGLLVEDREVLWRLRPGYEGPPDAADPNAHLVPARIDEHGFRVNGDAAVPTAERERILTIGDSFTFGWDVADVDTYPAQLQRILDHRAPGRFEVINGGMPGCTSFQAVRLLRREIPALEPKVLITLLGRNDGRVAAISDRAAHKILRWKPAALNYVFPFMFLHHNSVGNLAQAVGRARQQRVSDQDFQTNMDAIAQIALSNGVRLIVMQHWSRTSAVSLASFAEARKLRYIDTPRLLEAASNSGAELFIRAHFHPNRDGYAVIANALADAVLQ